MLIIKLYIYISHLSSQEQMSSTVLVENEQRSEGGGSEFPNNTSVLRGDGGTKTKQGKVTAKLRARSSNEVADTMHGNKENMEPNTQSLCMHTPTHRKSGNSQKYSRLHAHVAISFYSLESRFTIT